MDGDDIARGPSEDTTRSELLPPASGVVFVILLFARICLPMIRTTAVFGRKTSPFHRTTLWLVVRAWPRGVFVAAAASTVRLSYHTIAIYILLKYIRACVQYRYLHTHTHTHTRHTNESSRMVAR